MPLSLDAGRSTTRDSYIAINIAKGKVINFLAVFKSFHIRICNRFENTQIFFTQIIYNSLVLWWTLHLKIRNLHRIIIFIIILSGVRLSLLRTAATTGLLYQPQMIDDGDSAAVGGAKIGSGSRSTGTKPATELLCSPQIPHDLTRTRSLFAAVGSQRLTAWAMARPYFSPNVIKIVRSRKMMWSGRAARMRR
jgi:hypothetical protein